MTINSELEKQKQENPLFAKHYLNYQGLKDAVAQADVAQVMRLLKIELDKINDIVEMEWDALSRELQTRMRKSTDGPLGPETAESLENLSQAVVRLSTFIELNYEAFKKIMTKCSQHPDTEGKFAAATAAVRELQSEALPVSAEGSPQAFLLPQHLLMQIKVSLLKVLNPIGTISKAKTNQGSRNTTRMTAAMGQQQTSVYFDSTTGHQYSERMKRRCLGFPAGSGPTGKLLQCRMGPPPVGEGGAPGDLADPTREVVVDIQDERYQSSTVVLPQKSMLSLASGKATSKNPVEEAAAEAIRERQLRPAVSATSFRSSYAAAGISELVTVDEQITYRDEAALADGKAWCFAASKTGAATTTRSQVDYPGGILKVWLPPAACSKLLAALNLPTQEFKFTPGFSDALLATALLHRELANPMPPWIPNDGLGLGSPLPGASLAVNESNPGQPSTERGHSNNKAVAKSSPEESETPMPRWRRCLVGVIGAPKQSAKDPELLVDCKTPLAIERTLLRWMRSTIMLASLSSLLMSSGDIAGRINGVLLGIACLCFAYFPLMNYLERSKQLLNPKAKQPKVDRTMPRILTCTFCFVLFSAVAVSTLIGD
eukprot:CAMPEP_0206516778 /NCGR_PEP_ID=MMETSP0324_2-20121206/63561_1 /ASSEMBLY_ACC=CAM_ASM_000836 /TAXON_ID=2866 /ORGANISM="Crypthecodinium cohnii, Strain Seligo" /LENGTH=600 /DNA_ID=CAMNT_0054009759 /DNA_START=243 /DNA_END=2045 /DNA_ORIENTATION=-